DKESMSILDAIALQEHRKKEADFDKPDEELTPTEHVFKALYKLLDEEVEKSLGKEVKKDIDKKRTIVEKLSKLQANLTKLTELGKEIEKNLVIQGAYLINYYQKDENNDYFIITRKLDQHAMSESTPID